MEKNFTKEKFNVFKKRFDEISDLITKKNIISNNKKYISLYKEYKTLKKVLKLYSIYNKKHKSLIEAENFLSKIYEDLEFKEIAKEEKNKLLFEIKKIENEIKDILTPKKIKYKKDIILEIRAGTGGNESSIFVENILRMYTMYFKNRNWNYQIINAQESSIKGYKEIILEVSSKKDNIYDILKFESGVHRVQRIPETESKGRVHTSAITIAILPKIEPVQLNINASDIKRDTFRSSGAGGQHVNKTESAIRLTHIPTGIVAECQDGRSQHKNYEKALSVLRSRIYQLEVEKKAKNQAFKRRTLVSTGDRSAKIRTYNFPQGRVTDHRINKSFYSIDEFMNGNIQNMIDSLIFENSKYKEN